MSVSRTDRICGAVADRREWIVELLGDLVRLNTVNPYSGDPNYGSEKVGQEYLVPVLEKLGATRLDLFDCPADIYARMNVIGPAERDFTDRPNLVGEFDFGPGPTIILCAHMDTVGTVGMTIEPFAAEIREGRMYGRGTGDDKAGIAAMLGAIAGLLDAGINLSGKIIFESVVEEECSGSGAGVMACVERGYIGDVAVVSDGPATHIYRGCLGCMEAAVNVYGFASHCSNPEGISAFDKAVVVKEQIDALGARRVAENSDALVNIGVVHLGSHPGIVPGEAYMGVNMQYTVEEAQAAEAAGLAWGGALVRQEFEEAVARAAQADEWLRQHPPTVTWVKDLQPFDQDPSDPWIQSFLECYGEVTADSPALGILHAWGDSACQYLKGKMPTIGAGCSSPGQPHSDDESVELDDVARVATATALFLAKHLSR